MKTDTVQFSKAVFWVLVLAFCLRLAGVGFGLPRVYHADEPEIINRALAIGEKGPNPEFFGKPPFAIYSVFGCYALYFIAGHLAGSFHDKMDFALSFFRDPTPFYLIGRMALGVFFGTAAVWLLARFGRRHLDARAGIWAALFLAVVLLHVQHSHYAYADVPLAFAVLLFFHEGLATLKQPTWKNYLFVGAAFGWAVSVKYSAVFFLPGFLAAWFWIRRKTLFKDGTVFKALAAKAMAAAVFALMAPYTFLDWKDFHRQVFQQASQEEALGPWFHLAHSLMFGTSPLFLFLVLLGIPALLKRYRDAGLVLSLSALSYYGVNCVFSQPFARYMVPMVPLVCVFAAFGDSVLGERLKDRRVLTAVRLAVLASLLVPSLYSDHLMMKKDTRTDAEQWVNANVRSGTAIALDSRFYGPHLSESEESLRDKAALLNESIPRAAEKAKRLEWMGKVVSGKTAYRLLTLYAGGDISDPGLFFSRPFVRADIGELKKQGVEYVVLNGSYSDAAVRRWADSEGRRLEEMASFDPRIPGWQGYEDPLSSTAAPLDWWDLFSRKQLGPAITIYRLKP